MPFPQTLSWPSGGGVGWKEKKLLCKGVGKVIPTNPNLRRGGSGIGDDQEILGTDRLSAAAAAVSPKALLAAYAEQRERRIVASPLPHSHGMNN